MVTKLLFRGGAMPKSSEQRLAYVQDLIADGEMVRIDRLARDFGVSEMTVRRDLYELEIIGAARRVRGGATAREPEQFAVRHRHNGRAKAKIVNKLRPLLPASGTLAVDASSTVFRLARTLEARDLVVVTNGIETFHAMRAIPGIEATLTGGNSGGSGSLTGALAVRHAQSFSYEFFICSAAGVDEHSGTYEASADEAAVKQVFGEAAAKVLLAVDHTKLGTRAAARTLEFEHIDLLVTDLEPWDQRLDPYRDRVEVM
jgi:DeoR family transcriptional regulator, fructose operon transcriptional repressor